MNKIPDLELEIIRFNTEDVIVTSGSVTSISRGFLANNWYFTLGREINQAGLDELLNKQQKYFYYFHAVDDGNSFQYYKNGFTNDVRNLQGSGIDYYYTWYGPTTGWQTENKTYEYYLPGNSWTD